MREAQFLGIGLTLLALGMLAGCQRGPVALSPVSGKVSYKGLALPSGTIVFTPDSGRGESGPIAHGKINVDGTYHLASGEALGAMPGWYRITVIAYASAGQPLPGERFAVPPSLIPEKYRDPELSLLTCEVKPGRANTIDFNLD